MNEIDCEICRDLMPLVKDKVASQSSEKAVIKHLSHCTECRKVFGETEIPQADSAKIFKKIKSRLQIFGMFLLMIGIFFGLSLTASEDLFFNMWLMPILGMIGYQLFRWKALWEVPMLLLIVHFATNYLGIFRGMEHLDLWGLLWWTGMYSLFAVWGTLIVGLLHFAFQDFPKRRKEK